MAASIEYVMADDCGVRRVGATRVSLDSVVYAFRDGRSPESIRDAYPALSLEEVYGAIAYYLARKPEVEAYLEQQERSAAGARERADAERPPVVDRLRQLIRSREATNHHACLA